MDANPFIPPTLEEAKNNPQMIALRNAAVVRSKAGWTYQQVMKAFEDGRNGIEYKRHEDEEAGQ